MHAYHQMFILVGLIDAVVLVLTAYIVYVLMKLNRLVGTKGLLLVLIGYFVFSLGLSLSIASSMLVVFYGPNEPRGPPGLVIGTRRGLFLGEELALRVGFAAWSIIGYSSIVYAVSYALVLAGLITSRYSMGGIDVTNRDTSDYKRLFLATTFVPNSILGAAQPLLSASYLLLTGDGVSIALLAGIVFFHSGYLRGRLGYLLLLVSHALRLLAVFSTSPWVLIVAEIVRPLGLILIATALAGASKK